MLRLVVTRKTYKNVMNVVCTRPILGDPFNPKRRGHRGMLLLQIRKLHRVRCPSDDVNERIIALKAAIKKISDRWGDNENEWRALRYVDKRKPWEGKIYGGI